MPIYNADTMEIRGSYKNADIVHKVDRFIECVAGDGNT